MPRSKRQQITNLTQTEKKGRKAKEELFAKVREAMDTWQYAYVISVHNMRNLFLKEMRENWKSTGRIFWGSNKVMAKSLGASNEDEYQMNSHLLGSQLHGNVGLFFTDSPPPQVQEYFSNFQRQDYARGGTKATIDFVLPAGPLVLGQDAEPFPHSMEPQLRQLGVPSRLKNGIVTVGSDYTVCKVGQTLTCEQARLLKMFYQQTAIFSVDVLAYWNNGQFEQLIDPQSLNTDEGDTIIEAEEIMLQDSN